MIGLGVLPISDSWYAFTQKIKGIEEYNQLVEQKITLGFRGHILSKEDIILRQHILNLMCHFQTSWKNQSFVIKELNDIVFKLKEMEADGLVIFNGDGIKITQKEQP